MKRTIACLLACLLMLPGMLVYVSAEEGNFVAPDLMTADWNFQYDDSKVYLPVIQVGLISTYKPGEVELGPLEDPFTDYSGGPFVDIEEAWEYMFARCEVMSPYDLAAAEKLLSDLQLDEDIYFGTVYNITFNWSITRHELISLAHLLVTDPVAWFWLLGVDPDTANECSVYVSLVPKTPIVEEYDGDNIRDGYVVADIDHDYVAKDYPWSVEDFPELDLSDARINVNKTRVILKLNDSSKEATIDAVQKLANRWEFTRVGYSRVIYVDPIYPIPDPIDTTDETTVSVTEEQTTDSAAAETTGTPEKPTSPPTGDAGIYVACVLAAAFVGIVGVVVYRRRRAA